MSVTRHYFQLIELFAQIGHLMVSEKAYITVHILISLNSAIYIWFNLPYARALDQRRYDLFGKMIGNYDKK